MLGDVRVAIAPLGQDLSVLDHGDDGAGDVAGVQRVGHVAVEPGIDILARSAATAAQRLGGGQPLRSAVRATLRANADAALRVASIVRRAA